MPNPIVVPLDGSQNAETALPAALQLAQLYGSPLRLVHVLDDHIKADGDDYAPAVELFKNYAEQLLADHGGAALAHETVVLTGSAAQSILDAAAGALFIVLATHGRGGFHATFIGSVADKIVRGCGTPVLAIPVGSPVALNGGPIAVAVDGSEDAEKGLVVARDLAGRLQSQVVLVRAYTMPPAAGVQFVAYPVDTVDIMKQAAEEYVAGLARQGEEAYAVLGTPVDAIQQVADQVDARIITMSSHGKGLAARVALGSTTDRALHTLRRPLLIVPIHNG
jgi:nucleotide-binding universal stress UspA family protein